MSSAAGPDKEYGNTVNRETFRTSLDFLNLESISRSLICQEDSTIYCLPERAQYGYNAFIYEADAFAEDGLEGSLVEHVVKESEMFHAKLGRFESASERPFFPKELPDMFLPPNQCVIIDVNHKMWDVYFQNLLPNLVKEGSDGFYASSAVRDANCLLAISKRVHTGRFFAESKFTANTKEYTAAIKAQDKEALMNLLSYPKVEENVKERVLMKAKKLAEEVAVNEESQAAYKIYPSLVRELYARWVIPLTKEVQVEYLLRRLS
ncbi:unnamed protein product [Linum tenue]|uniref:chorismate mutase n=1 Tax=Linum tenue TaxID=586396 RepID=A0AAV0HSY0_9ROSI|nr:unnamed protein product [Linum tenue]